jgi:hypothetical protein
MSPTCNSRRVFKESFDAIFVSLLKGGGVARCLQRLTATPPARRESHLGARYINLGVGGVHRRYRTASVD